MTRVIIAQLPVYNNIAELPGLALGRLGPTREQQQQQLRDVNDGVLVVVLSKLIMISNVLSIHL